MISFIRLRRRMTFPRDIAHRLVSACWRSTVIRYALTRHATFALAARTFHDIHFHYVKAYWLDHGLLPSGDHRVRATVSFSPEIAKEGNPASDFSA